MTKKILIVEDEQIIAEDMRKSLENIGYTVCGMASTGKEALKKAQETLPDLALVDIVLKGDMDGIETADKMSSQFNIPIVYVTSFKGVKVLQRVKSPELCGYVMKPFSMSELCTVIRESLRRYN